MSLSVLAPLCFGTALAWLWYHASTHNQTQRKVAAVLIGAWVLSMIAYAHMDDAGRLVVYGVIAAVSARILISEDAPRWQLVIAATFLVNLSLTLTLYSSIKFGDPFWWALYAWLLTIIGYLQIALTAWLGSDERVSTAGAFLIRFPVLKRFVAWARDPVAWPSAPLGQAEKQK